MKLDAKIILLVALAVGCAHEKKVEDDDPNKKDGIIKSYRKNGQLFSTVSMKDGKQNGISRNYYSNDTVSVETEYKDDKKNGMFRQYYESGKLMKEIMYKDDQMNGLNRKFRKDGKPAWVARYDDDKPCTGLVEYYLNGTQKTDYPRIVFEAIDRLHETGRFKLRVHMSDYTTTVDFYEGTLDPGGCFDKRSASKIWSPVRGVVEKEYHLIPGGFAMGEVRVIAVVKTAQSNSYITTGLYNLSITN